MLEMIVMDGVVCEDVCVVDLVVKAKLLVYFVCKHEGMNCRVMEGIEHNTLEMVWLPKNAEKEMI